MKQRLKEHVDYINFKSGLILKVHEELIKKYRLFYVAVRSATVVFALIITTFSLINKKYLINNLGFSGHNINVLISVVSVLLFIVTVLGVALKLDKKIYIHEQAIEKYNKFIKELIYKKYEIKEQNMSSYKSFMLEIGNKYNKIMETLPSEYFLRVNSMFCKKYEKFHKPEELIKFPNDNGKIPVFMPGYNV